MKSTFTRAAALFVGATLAGFASAQSFIASTERAGYTGVINVYSSLSDAQTGTNAIRSNQIVPQRDLSVYTTSGFLDGSGEDWNQIGTNWYSSNTGSYGVGNPNNTNEGFVQLSDEGATTLTTLSGGFTNGLADFTVTATGANATASNAFARLWNAGATQGSSESTTGTFINYEYTLTALGVNGVDNGAGFYVNANNATGYTGHFSGIFQNLSTTSPDSNGYYTFDLTFNNISWAAGNAVGSATGVMDDQFVAAVPEPTSMAVLGLGVVAMIKRRRNKSK